MTDPDNAGSFAALVRLQRTSAMWTGIIGLAALMGELVLRITAVEASPSLTMLACVALGALAGQTVPLRRNGHHQGDLPK